MPQPAPQTAETRAFETLQHNLNLAGFASFIVLSPYAHNMGQVTGLDLLQGLGLVALLTLALLALARGITGSWGRGAIATIALLTLFFAYQWAWDGADDLRYRLGWHRFQERHFLSLYVLVITTVLLTMRRWPRNLRAAGTIMSAVVLALLALPFLTIGQYLVFEQAGSDHPDPGLSVPKLRPLAVSEAGPPNIVLLVFDRYANSDVLKAQLEFDNEPFLADLEARGFFVARHSHSNYLRTAHSLAATLNLDYLDDLASAIGPRSRDYLPLYHRIQHPLAARALQEAGYRFDYFGSWWGPTRELPSADHNFNLSTLPELLTLLYERSLLEPFDRRFRFFFFSIESQCQRVPFKVRALRERLASAEEPVFAFAHFLLPHPPHVFDADGNCVTEAGVGRSSYLKQLRYANKEIIALVDAIQEGADRPTIVLLQADEGPYPSRYGENDDDFDWTAASEQELRLKTGILNAVYFPRRDYRGLATDMTPVNTFRHIFNRYFGTTLPLLPDRTFAHRDEAHIFDFHDITDKVQWPRLARGGNLTDSSDNDLASSTPGRP